MGSNLLEEITIVSGSLKWKKIVREANNSLNRRIEHSGTLSIFTPEGEIFNNS